MRRLRVNDRVLCVLGNDDWLRPNTNYTVSDVMRTKIDGRSGDYLIELKEIPGMLWWPGRFKLYEKVLIRETKRY